MIGEHQFEHRAAVLDPVRIPKFTRACEEVEGGSISLAEAPYRLAACRHAIPHQRLIGAQVFDPPLIGRNHGRARRIDNPIKQLLNLPIDCLQLFLQRRALRPRAGKLGIPQIAELLKREVEQAFRRPQRAEQGFELALDDLLADGLAGNLATARVAQVIGIFGAAALRPAGGKRHAAMAAGDKAPQGEVFGQVRAGWHLGDAKAAILDRLPGGQADQRRVLGRDQAKIPVFDCDVAGIGGPGENLVHPLDMHLVVAVARVSGLRFEEALHFRWRLEPARGVAFQGFGDDRGQRLIPHQHLAMTGNPLVAVADRRARHPIAIHGPRPHAVRGLLGVLLALMLGDRGEQVLDQDGVRTLPKLDRGAFELAARLAQQVAQIPMAANVAGKAADVIDDDDAPAAALRLDQLQHRRHGRADSRPAARIVAEDLDDLIALIAGILAAAGFLAAQPVTVAELLRARHAGVDDGSLRRRFFHVSGALPSIATTFVVEGLGDLARAFEF